MKTTEAHVERLQSMLFIVRWKLARAEIELAELKAHMRAHRGGV